MNNIDLLLIRPNDKKAVYNGMPDGATASDPPYWLAMMGGYMRKKGINVVLLDAEGENISPEDTVERIKKMKPSLIGILTIGSNLTASTWKMHGTSILTNAIKKSLEEIPIFLWGNHVSAVPDRTLQDEKADFVVIGEGFSTIGHLTSKVIEKNQDYSDIKGLLYRDLKGQITGNREMQLIESLDDLPYDGWNMLPNQIYRNHMHFAFEDLSKRDQYGAILTSLGCPYRCTYCAICYFSGDKKIRYKSIEKSLEEIDYWVKERNVYYLRIMDECFTFDREHVVNVCQGIIDRGYKLSIWINARVDLVDKELLELMYQAGIRWIGYGFESGSKKIRNTVLKGQYGFELIKDVVKMTHDAGIHICSNFMFGLPGDDMDSMKESLQLAKELCCEWPNLYCTMAYPGSKLYYDLIDKGHKMPDSWLAYTQLGYETEPFPTEHLTSKQILEFRDYAFDEFFNNEQYFKMIEEKFGKEAIEAIQKVLKNKLKRKILE